MSEHSLDWPYKAIFDGELDVSAGVNTMFACSYACMMLRST